MNQVQLFVIGDEILSGKRQDRHLRRVIELLNERGIALAAAHFLADDETRIADALRAAIDEGDIVLSCGGIGATPDDVTRQAAALAFGVPIERHPEAAALIHQRSGGEASGNRLIMADFPQGAELIPNPINTIAGFSCDHCYFVPGFPEMAWPMLEWVLDERLPQLHNAEPPEEFRLRVYGVRGESDLLDLMHDILARFEGIKLSSLPSHGGPGMRPHIEFGIRGARGFAAEAFMSLRAALKADAQIEVEDLKLP